MPNADAGYCCFFNSSIQASPPSTATVLSAIDIASAIDVADLLMLSHPV